MNAVIFDLDGLLIDSEPVWDAIKMRLVDERGGRWTESASADMMGMSPREWPAYMQSNLGLGGMTQEDIERWVINGVRESYIDHLPLIPGARETVIRIASARPIGLASSSSRSLIELFLKLSGLRSCFSVVVASEEVERGKPAPDVYIEACKQLNMKPECVVAVEDSGSGILAARRAGLHVVAIPNASYLPDPGILAEADRVLETIGSLSEEVVASILGEPRPCLS